MDTVMKINEILTEQELDEISRRDFLKGAGAAVGLAAIPQIAKAEDYQSRTIGNWNISIIKSKFKPTQIYATGGATHPYYGSLVYENNTLYYSGGNGKFSSKFHMIKPSSVVRYIVDNGPIQSTKTDSSGIINFTKQIPLFVKSKKIELSFDNYNTLNYAVNQGFETEILIDGLGETIDFMKNFESVLSKEKSDKDYKDNEFTRELSQIGSLIEKAKYFVDQRNQFLQQGDRQKAQATEYEISKIKGEILQIPRGNLAWDNFVQTYYNKQ